MARDIASILIANRGEIACRIMRTTQSMGIKAIAVYSDADANAPHVKMADQSVHIGASPTDQSYLVIKKIIDAAKETQADAVHPGYGFLSENAEFARACAENDLIFIGPMPDAIEIMGSKAASKTKMTEVGVPCVPGYNGEDQSSTALLSAAQEIGFPIMVKASAGGGGRGMRLVEDVQDLSPALDLARSEAKNAFGDDHLILEKAIINPRHIEIQVFGDTKGNLIHLGERDCSVQRRHQKIIEEAPSPVVSVDLRNKMGDAAIKAAKAVDYVGAGTVEFLLDEAGDFYFLEMNTRLQVEHPVSELITGLDFVKMQIDIAVGKSLPINQEQVTFKGHAIEARVYCEDPEAQFLPSTGHVDFWHTPDHPYIRSDAGITTGTNVSPYYDPMAAKLIAYGPSRDIALKRLTRALKDTNFFGPKNNLAFLIACLRKETFKRGEATTGFIQEEFANGIFESVAPSAHGIAAAAVIEHELNARRVNVPPHLKNWASAGCLTSRSQYVFGSDTFDVSIIPNDVSSYTVYMSEDEITVEVEYLGQNDAILNVSGTRIIATFLEMKEGDFWLNLEGTTRRFQNYIYMPPETTGSIVKGAATAPMHGLLTDILVHEGDFVKSGQSLAILEAMKMQHEITAATDGTVKAIHTKVGQQLSADTLIIEIEPNTNAVEPS